MIATERSPYILSGFATPPRIISEIKKPFPGCIKDNVRPRITGELLCFNPTEGRWRSRRVAVRGGQLFVGGEKGGGNEKGGCCPRLALRRLNLTPGPHENSFALRVTPDTPPLLTLQASNQKEFDNWVRTIAIELIRQTPLDAIKYLDIFTLTPQVKNREKTNVPTKDCNANCLQMSPLTDVKNDICHENYDENRNVMPVDEVDGIFHHKEDLSNLTDTSNETSFITENLSNLSRRTTRTSHLADTLRKTSSLDETSVLTDPSRKTSESFSLTETSRKASYHTGPPSLTENTRKTSYLTGTSNLTRTSNLTGTSILSGTSNLPGTSNLIGTSNLTGRSNLTETSNFTSETSNLASKTSFLTGTSNLTCTSNLTHVTSNLTGTSNLTSGSSFLTGLSNINEDEQTVEILLKKCQNSDSYVPVKEKLKLFESLCRLGKYHDDLSNKSKYPSKRTRSLHDLSHSEMSNLTNCNNNNNNNAGVKQICKYFETKSEMSNLTNKCHTIARIHRTSLGPVKNLISRKYSCQTIKR